MRAFLQGLRPLLKTALESRLPDHTFTLATAEESWAYQLPGASNLHDTVTGVKKEEAIVLDTLANFDGLEQLVVIAVGLDAKVKGAGPEVQEALETRSRIYRVVTRAKLLLCMVNEFIEGGLMELLQRSELNDPRAAVEKLFQDDVSLYDEPYRQSLQDGVKYSPEQTFNQDLIANQLIKHATRVLKPWAIFMAGAPGSGKGHVIRQWREAGILPSGEQEFAHLDLDANRVFLKAWKEDTASPKSQATVIATQIEAGFINDLAAARCSRNKKCFVI